ncbi:unnamed protein product [Didymodactylos carnosus]|uniref:Uncharacterized protein n=1 Tax=Didymodactylos carnosus TaxID=1234261 RepID=A0A8S2G221_9BILA|nr:unnamed protein product [Didymodactylos carnosus]CAF4421284.1 unnamed protein product [Didymodactylos carnosus]
MYISQSQMPLLLLGTSNSNTWNAQQQLQYASAQQQPAQPAYDQQSLYAYYASYAAHMYNQQQQEQPQQTQSGISPMDPSLSSNNGALTDAEGQVQKQSNSASSAYQPYPQQR